MEKMRWHVLLLYYSEETCYVSDGENAAKFFIFVLLWRSTCYVDTCLILWIIWLYSCSAGCVSTKGFGIQIIIAARSSKRFIVLNLLALRNLRNIYPWYYGRYQTKPNINCCYKIFRAQKCKYFDWNLKWNLKRTSNIF